VDRHVLNRIEWEYQKRPHEFLPAVHDGTIPAYIYRNDGMGQPEDYGLALRSNELVSGRLVPATMKGINLQTEDDYLVHLIRSIARANVDVVLHHHGEADETFVNRNWGAASGET
jgi:hypothetical protein